MNSPHKTKALMPQQNAGLILSTIFIKSIRLHKTLQIIENTHCDHGKFSQPVVSSMSENETITAVDMPWTLMHQ
jgi:hypothetical protein